MRPPIELMKTIRPRALADRGSIAWVTATWAIRLTSTWRRKSSMRQRLQRARDADPGVVDEAVEAAPPCSAAIRAAAAAIWSASVTSSISGTSALGAGRRAASRRPPRLRTPAKTLQPAASRRSAVARPIPVEAPVTRTERTAAGYLAATA